MNCPCSENIHITIQPAINKSLCDVGLHRWKAERVFTSPSQQEIEAAESELLAEFALKEQQPRINVPHCIRDKIQN